ncbi:MAG: carbon starvation protein A [Ignavibacteria bacterium]|jgi:carbon starvation protein CstA|nr:carbon starvation protein A [Ignavibacteria bacterium]
MITFIICFAALVVAYFTYGRFMEKLFGVDVNMKMPSDTSFDGVDYIPLPKWKTFLIQLLNIAGLGPIFGAVLGATYGPVAFLWITMGGIFIGGVHDFASGYISIKMNGASFTEIVNKYLGRGTRYVNLVFMVILMMLVGAVFMVGPAVLLDSLLDIGVPVWVWIILLYYLAATLLPIDKIIGRIYPIFGFVLAFMALGLLYVILTGDYVVPELSFVNMKIDADSFPLIPTLCITIACGAVSGFHATQSPLMARCLTNAKQIRPVFYGAMIAESLIALIWAAIAMAFFGGVAELNATLAANSQSAAYIVDLVCHTTMGKIGAVLALLGVVVAPITSGDTALRGARLMVADFFHIDQRNLLKRVWIALPLFIVAYFITQIDFDVLWRYFAWLNQTLAVATLWVGTLYLAENKRQYIFTMLPATFMTYIITSYLFVSNQFLGLEYVLGSAMGGVLTLGVVAYFIRKIKKMA